MGRFRQPGDPGYYTPDETFASTEPVDNLIASGYMLSPEQVAGLPSGSVWNNANVLNIVP